MFVTFVMCNNYLLILLNLQAIYILQK